MTIETYGTGERIKVAAALARELMPRHLVILPVPTTKDKICVTKTDLPLKKTLSGVGEGSVVVGYGMPEEYKNSVRVLGGRVFDLLYDERFLCDNAYLTALGALGYILNTAKKEPKDTVYGIVGYGRIGSRLAAMLLFFGARVRVYTSKELTRVELGECGIDTVSMPEGDFAFDFSGVEVLINTAPHDMTESFPEGKIREGMRVLELASGENFIGVDGVERLPALPERMFSESSGRAYFEAVKRFLSQENGG